MTLIEQQANEYAEERLKSYPSVFGMLKCDISKVIAEAYEQGWVDRDTRDMKPETEEEFLTENRICPLNYNIRLTLR